MRLHRLAAAATAIAATAMLTATPATASPARWTPMPGTSWQVQYSGKLDKTVDASMFDIDLFDSSAATIAKLHAAGHVVVCYYSSGSWENWRPDASAFPKSVLGKDLAGWPGEKWLDVRQLDVLEPIMGARLDLAVEKGCDGVDPDNVDGYANPTGFPLHGADQLAYNQWTASAAHSRGLAVGLKNDLGQVKTLAAAYDFAVNEQCFQYRECGKLKPFTAVSKPVFNIEYKGTLDVLCPQAATLGFETIMKNRSLNAWRAACPA